MKEDDMTICFLFTRKQTTFRRAQWNRHLATVPISKFLQLKSFKRSQAPIKTRQCFNIVQGGEKKLKSSCPVGQYISVASTKILLAPYADSRKNRKLHAGGA